MDAPARSHSHSSSDSGQSAFGSRPRRRALRVLGTTRSQRRRREDMEAYLDFLQFERFLDERPSTPHSEADTRSLPTPDALDRCRSFDSATEQLYPSLSSSGSTDEDSDQDVHHSTRLQRAQFGPVGLNMRRSHASPQERAAYAHHLSYSFSNDVAKPKRTLLACEPCRRAKAKVRGTASP